MFLVFLKNEVCYFDCFYILDSYVEDINRIYVKVGRGNFCLMLNISNIIINI